MIMLQHITSNAPKLPAIGATKLLFLVGAEAIVSVEVGVVDVDVYVSVDEAADTETVELGDVRFNPASATEELHTTFPHRKYRASPGCPALTTDKPAK
jgi:hypothetical protein